MDKMQKLMEKFNDFVDEAYAHGELEKSEYESVKAITPTKEKSINDTKFSLFNNKRKNI
jgi:hypothetical protein